MSTDIQLPSPEDNQLIAERREKLAELRAAAKAAGQAVFPNDFKPQHRAGPLHHQHDGAEAEALEAQAVPVSVAGRMMLKRVMGKACFATLQDATGRIQLYITQDMVGPETLAAFKRWDLGDILACEGTLFKTKTGELSVKVTTLRLLTKSLRPMPDKFHGVADQEVKYRQRYIDLMTDEAARKRFVARSRDVSGIRDFMVQHGFLEVETPMLHPIPGGANAKPFITHHNALEQEMYLRIAPELFLKRLLVGGFERVFEINRNFRNEGLSTRHNPEFTMIEFYQAYADYNDLMDLTEEMLRCVAQEVLGTTCVVNTVRNEAGEVLETFEYDLGKPFTRMSVFDSILHFNPEITAEALADAAAARQIAERMDIDVKDGWGLGKIQIEIFEKTVEHRLQQPTFITAYPTEVSPLARRNDNNPQVTDRFEFFIGGRELANGFSELNDAEDQAERFRKQVEEKEAGDEEAMHYDADYINALEYGLPPTAGEGIGIDRLVMLLTDSASIRDVLLFPAMRPRS